MKSSFQSDKLRFVFWKRNAKKTIFFPCFSTHACKSAPPHHFCFAFLLKYSLYLGHLSKGVTNNIATSFFLLASKDTNIYHFWSSYLFWIFWETKKKPLFDYNSSVFFYFSFTMLSTLTHGVQFISFLPIFFNVLFLF